MELTSKANEKSRHDVFAPYWAIAFIIFAGTGLSTIWFEIGPFWNGYVLDMTGPAWNYILFRGLYTAQADNVWTRFFTPEKTFYIFISVCVGIESAQYFNLYESTYDPWDFLAYVSILIPIYLLDTRLSKQVDNWGRK